MCISIKVDDHILDSFLLSFRVDRVLACRAFDGIHQSQMGVFHNI